MNVPSFKCIGSPFGTLSSQVRIWLINSLRKEMDAAYSAPSPIFEVAFMPFNDIANSCIRLRNAGCSTPQENIDHPRASASRVSGDLVSAGNAVVSFSSSDCTTTCERRANNISVDVPLPTNCAHKTLEEIAKQFGVSVSDLEVHLKQLMKEFSAEMAKTKSSTHPQYFPLIDAIYNLHVLSKENENLSLPWMDTLKDFDLFMGHFCPKANLRSRAYIVRQVGIFCGTHISKNTVEETMVDNVPKQLYGMKDKEWDTLLGHRLTVPVFEEIKKLTREKKYPLKENHLIHHTGSAALEGIGDASAILSARVSLEHNYKIKTGSYVLNISSYDDAPNCGGKKGLSEVYTSTYRFGEMSIDQRWFDEWPMEFCIDEEKQNKYNEQHDILQPIKRSDVYSSYDKDLKPHTSQVTVGSKVPLQNIMAIFAPKDNESQVKMWMDQYCPQAEFISLEAVTIIERVGSKKLEEYFIA